MVRAGKPPFKGAAPPPLGNKDAADMGPADVVMLRIGELDAVEQGQLHRAASRSTYLARTSTSRFTWSPGFSEPSVVASSVCRTSATSKLSSVSAVIVSETPSTVIEPFSTQ